MNILVVEDDALIALDLETILADAGYEVLGPVSNAQSAIRLTQRRKPDLALVDVKLAGGGNGIDLARELKADWQVDSLFVTAQSREAGASRDAALGLVKKPYTASRILAAVDLTTKLLCGEDIKPVSIPKGVELFKCHL